MFLFLFREERYRNVYIWEMAELTSFVRQHHRRQHKFLAHSLQSFSFQEQIFSLSLKKHLAWIEWACFSKISENMLGKSWLSLSLVSKLGWDLCHNINSGKRPLHWNCRHTFLAHFARKYLATLVEKSLEEMGWHNSAIDIFLGPKKIVFLLTLCHIFCSAKHFFMQANWKSDGIGPRKMIRHVFFRILLLILRFLNV